MVFKQQNRSAKVDVRFTPDELEQLRTLAGTLDVSVSSFVRQASLFVAKSEEVECST